MGFRLEQQHLAPRQRQRAGDCKANDARTDDHAFDFVCHRRNLSERVSCFAR
jgi:hypothetical protein